MLIWATDQHMIPQRQSSHRGFWFHRQQILKIVRIKNVDKNEKVVLFVLGLRYFAGARFANGSVSGEST